MQLRSNRTDEWPSVQCDIFLNWVTVARLSQTIEFRIRVVSYEIVSFFFLFIYCLFQFNLQTIWIVFFNFFKMQKYNGLIIFWKGTSSRTFTYIVDREKSKNARVQRWVVARPSTNIFFFYKYIYVYETRFSAQLVI